jgi:hypothetical protein
MTNPTVPATEPTSEPDPFDVLSAELHRVADDIATLVDSGLPAPRLFQLNIQPGGRHADDDLTARAIDAMATALLGVRGQVQKMGSGVYHYGTDHSKRGPIEVVVYGGISTPWALENDVAAAEAALAEREAEVAKMRADVEALRASRSPHGADETGLNYTRADSEPDDPTPVSPARVPLHTGSVVDGDVLVTDPAVQ